MNCSDFPETPGFGPAEWRLAFDPSSAEFYRAVPGTGRLRAVTRPFSPENVLEVVALAEVGKDHFAASACLSNGLYAALSARCDQAPHLRWTVGRDPELVLLSGLDWVERSVLLLNVVRPELATRLAAMTCHHPAVAHRLYVAPSSLELAGPEVVA